MEDHNIQLEREAKQSYLIDEIINGGHDPAQFKEYLDGIKPDGCSFNRMISAAYSLFI